MERPQGRTSHSIDTKQRSGNIQPSKLECNEAFRHLLISARAGNTDVVVLRGKQPIPVHRMLQFLYQGHFDHEEAARYAPYEIFTETLLRLDPLG